MDAVNVPAKFEVRSFTRSGDSWGTQKIGTVPEYDHAPFLPKFLMGFCCFVRMDPVNVHA